MNLQMAKRQTSSLRRKPKGIQYLYSRLLDRKIGHVDDRIASSSAFFFAFQDFANYTL